jgi:hypothetical protein
MIYLHLTGIAKFLNCVHCSVVRIEHKLSESGSEKWWGGTYSVWSIRKGESQSQGSVKISETL